MKINQDEVEELMLYAYICGATDMKLSEFKEKMNTIKENEFQLQFGIKMGKKDET